MTRSLAELLQGFVADAPVLAITGLCLDSRRIQPGEAFVALPGTQVHGLGFADDALAGGAVAVLWEPDGRHEPATADDRYIAVSGLREHLGTIAARFHGDPSAAMTLIGVTGTNGKTSSVQFMAQALSAAGLRCGTLGTLGAGLYGEEQPGTHTTPDAIAVQGALSTLRQQGAEAVAMEVSSHALDQGRVNGVKFDAAVFTNLSRDHLDYHGDMDAYRAAKTRLFTVPGLRFAILNADDPEQASVTGVLADTVERLDYGIDGGRVRALGVELTEQGMTFQLALPEGSWPVQARLLGRFNVYNLLAVAATLLALGWPAADIAPALSALEPVAGRMSLVGGAAQPMVVVDYAHTPDALVQSLAAARAHTRGALICVFGCGGDRDRGKRPLMAAAAEAGADRVLVTDDNPRSEDPDRIVADILAGFQVPESVQVERDRAAAIAAAIALAGPGDVVLVAGKGHEDYQEIDGERLHFDDREVARAVLEASA